MIILAVKGKERLGNSIAMYTSKKVLRHVGNVYESNELRFHLTL